MLETVTAQSGNTISPPSYQGDQVNSLKELGDRQLHILDIQLAEHARLNEMPLRSGLREALAAGDTTLPAGTLLHGTTIDEIESIAAHGVLSGELFGKPEDAETHYCADFFRVPEGTSLQDYSELITGQEPATGRMVRARMERNWLPNARTDGRGLSVIIDTDIPEMQALLEADAYRTATDELFDSIVEHLPVDKSSPKADRLSAILGGVPATAIAGVVMSERQLHTPGALERVQAAFNGCIPILNVRGELQANNHEVTNVAAT